MGKIKWLKLVCLVACALAVTACANKEAIKSESPTSSTLSAQQQGAVTSPTGTDARQKTPVAPVKSEGVATGASMQKTAVAEGLETIYFSFDSHTLIQATRDTLDRNFEKLRSNQALRISIEGHCDERGSGEYNLALGERRAKAAKEYLVTRGIAADRISIVSYGNERPAVDGHDEAAWAKNRRDEFVPEKN